MYNIKKTLILLIVNFILCFDIDFVFVLLFVVVIFWEVVVVIFGLTEVYHPRQFSGLFVLLFVYYINLFL